MSRKKALQAAKVWLEDACASPGTSVSFYTNDVAKMHGGGTSKYPHCRPRGLYNSDKQAWKVKLEWAPNKGSTRKEDLVEMFVLRTGGSEPTTQEVYAALIAKVNEMLER